MWRMSGGKYNDQRGTWQRSILVHFLLGHRTFWIAIMNSRNLHLYHVPNSSSTWSKSCTTPQERKGRTHSQPFKLIRLTMGNAQPKTLHPSLRNEYLDRVLECPRQEKRRHFSRFLEFPKLIVSDAGIPLGAVSRTCMFSTYGFCAVHSRTMSRWKLYTWLKF
jgi:hypothetical protein